jgi:ribosome-binding protein aMBF1 (putative translation factor)
MSYDYFIRRRAVTDLSSDSPLDRWAGRIPIPDNCPRLVRDLFEEMNRQGVSLGRVAKKVGYDRSTMKKWKKNEMSPHVVCLEDVGEVLGLKLCWRRKTNGHQTKHAYPVNAYKR